MNVLVPASLNPVTNPGRGQGEKLMSPRRSHPRGKQGPSFVPLQAAPTQAPEHATRTTPLPLLPRPSSARGGGPGGFPVLPRPMFPPITGRGGSSDKVLVTQNLSADTARVWETRGGSSVTAGLVTEVGQATPRTRPLTDCTGEPPAARSRQRGRGLQRPRPPNPGRKGNGTASVLAS